ncbi:hypothetical protein BDF19DRAFT_468212 [Syncephalis fuscata]|nr:hypothetical protein BDF19DRAFT_468212 [Syncephalis fuscata]
MANTGEDHYNTSRNDAAIDSIIENFGLEVGIAANTTEGQRLASGRLDEASPSSLAQLTQAWINERAAPELLFYEHLLVEKLQQALDAQIDKIDEWRDNTTEQNALEITIYQTEVERVRFVLRSYLRARLHKIEKYALYLLKDPDMASSLLSASEQSYAIEYQALVEKAHNASALNMLPTSQRALDEKATQYTLAMISEPNINAAVFCRSRKRIGEIQLPDSMDTLFMDENSMFLLRYSYIRDMLRIGEVELL